MKHTPEEIKNRLSNIGEAIGNIALDYITDLENENADLKEEINKIAFARGEVEKENAELKHIIATLRQEKDNVSMHAKAMEVVAKTRSDQLTKAKDLLAKWVELYKPKLEGYPITTIQEQTEQFISEVE